jgi:bacterioferritin-associated ferredoxin
MIVCLCKGVSDKHLRDALARGADTVEALSSDTGAGTGCGACLPMLHELVGAAGSELSVLDLVRLASEAGSRCADCPRRAAREAVPSKAP